MVIFSIDLPYSYCWFLCELRTSRWMLCSWTKCKNSVKVGMSTNVLRSSLELFYSRQVSSFHHRLVGPCCPAGVPQDRLSWRTQDEGSHIHSMFASVYGQVRQHQGWESLSRSDKTWSSLFLFIYSAITKETESDETLHICCGRELMNSSERNSWFRSQCVGLLIQAAFNRHREWQCCHGGATCRICGRV